MASFKISWKKVLLPKRLEVKWSDYLFVYFVLAPKIDTSSCTASKKCPSSFEQSNTSVASCHKWTPGDVWTNMEFIIYFILCVFMCFYVVLFFAIYLYFFLFSSYFRLFYFICFYLLLFAIMLRNNWTPLIELPPIGLPISIEDGRVFFACSSGPSAGPFGWPVEKHPKIKPVTKSATPGVTEKVSPIVQTNLWYT